MEINKPVKRKHVTYGPKSGKWDAIWNAVQKLKDGAALPVTCSDMEELRHIQAAALGSRRFKMKTNKEGLTLYIYLVGVRNAKTKPNA